jgi:hypothetical protein
MRPKGPPPVVHFSAVEAGTESLIQALADRDGEAADAAAAWLESNATKAEIAGALAPHALPALGAAGHANIYIGLLSAPDGEELVPMLRPVAAALASDPAEPIQVPVIRRDVAATGRLLPVLAGMAAGKPGPESFIAPLVRGAECRGVLARLLQEDGTFAAPSRPPVQLLRVAAQAMLQGPGDYAPYSWTHCLTLAQGALRAAQWTPDAYAGAYVAATYVASHLSAYAAEPLDLDYRPGPTKLTLERALLDSPAAAAGAAWYAPEQAVPILASRASAHPDAHRVKYTLACLDAAVEDPEAHRLYMAAAAYLNAWWEGQPEDLPF